MAATTATLETIDPRINQADRFLLLRRRLLLDDGRDVAFAIQNHPTVAGWILDLGRDQGGRRSRSTLKIAQPQQRDRRKQRRIAVQHHHQAVPI
jgi:hypothetical protein